MNQSRKNGVKFFIDQTIFRWFVKLVYPKYKRPRTGYATHAQIIKKFFFMQKVVGINRSVPWPVDFRTKIHGWQHIKKGIMCDPGDSPGCYINAYGGLTIGDDVEIAPNTAIVTENHDKYNLLKTYGKKGITIGNHVWIGANCTILAGTVIGDEVTIGAGCVVSGDIPSKSTVTRADNSIKIRPKTKDYQWDIYKEKLT